MDCAKINLIHLSNKLAKKKKLRIFYYLKPVLDEDEIKSNEYINLKYNENMNLMILENQLKEKKNRTMMYVTCSEKIKSYTGNKLSFIGKGTIKHPEGLKRIELSRDNSINNDSILVIETEVELEAFEDKDITFVMGAEENILSLQDTAYKYANTNNAINEYENVKNIGKTN